MKIVRGETPRFDDYAVLVLRKTDWWTRLVYGKGALVYEPDPLVGVIEADDETGLVVKQIYTKDGCAVYTNGVDDIVVDNAAKLLLLLGDVRQAFIKAGFRPKTTQQYVKGIRIINKTTASLVSGVPVLPSNTEKEVANA